MADSEMTANDAQRRVLGPHTDECLDNLKLLGELVYTGYNDNGDLPYAKMGDDTYSHHPEWHPKMTAGLKAGKTITQMNADAERARACLREHGKRRREDDSAVPECAQ